MRIASSKETNRDREKCLFEVARVRRGAKQLSKKKIGMAEKKAKNGHADQRERSAGAAQWTHNQLIVHKQSQQ